jgi:hypothetical protein
MIQIDETAFANALAQAMRGEQVTYKHTTPTGTPTAVMGHGRGGLFSHFALEKPIFSAMQLPIAGLQSLLPTRPTNTVDPLYGIMTGVTDTTGSEPYGVCDDPPYAGLMKLCMHWAPLGRYSRMTREFELDAFGKVQDRGDHLDLQLMNNPFAGSNQSMTPTVPGVPGNPMVNDVLKGLFEFATAWSRDFARQLYAGNPVNNTVGLGYKEFYGLDILINTGYRDAISGVVCPAADSYIKSFGNLDVSSNCATMVSELTWAMRHLRDISSRTGLDPATWVLAMRPMLFYLVTECWPCAYYTNKCTTAAGSEGVIDAVDGTNLRDDMRNGSYLLIDGVRVPVVQDEAIAETNVGAGVYSSSVYIVPLTVLGGTPVTLMEYFDYSTPNGFQAAAQAFAPEGSYSISDGGRFAWHKKPPTNWCVQMLAKTEPRVLLLTPYIAGRITNIRYTPRVHERDWDPDGTYYVNGGTSAARTPPSYYSPQA